MKPTDYVKNKSLESIATISQENSYLPKLKNLPEFKAHHINLLLYPCSPCPVNRKIRTVHETVTCMLHLLCYALSTWYYTWALLRNQRQVLNFAHDLQNTVSSLSCTGNIFLLTQRGVAEYKRSSQVSCHY